MIAGAVTPARMDLRNQDLLKAHLHSGWLAIVGLSLGRQMVESFVLLSALGGECGRHGPFERG